MGGRLSLTMHGASVGSWGRLVPGAIPQNPGSSLPGMRPGETGPSAELDTAANGAPPDVPLCAGTLPSSAQKPPLPPKR